MTDLIPLELELRLFCDDVVNRPFIASLVSVDDYEKYGSRLLIQKVIEEFTKHVDIKPELRSDAEYWIKERLGYYCIWLRQQVLRREQA